MMLLVMKFQRMFFPLTLWNGNIIKCELLWFILTNVKSDDTWLQLAPYTVLSFARYESCRSELITYGTLKNIVCLYSLSIFLSKNISWNFSLISKLQGTDGNDTTKILFTWHFFVFSFLFVRYNQSKTS